MNPRDDFILSIRLPTSAALNSLAADHAPASAPPGAGAVPLEPRLASKIVIDESGCWLWQAGIDRYGYGKYWRTDRNERAHRVVYELMVGPIAEGLTIDHLCRVRACVNPEHLEPVTPYENWNRGFNPCAINSRKTHCVHGHELSADNTYVNPKGWRECRICRAESVRRFHARRNAA